ncbi:MAG: FAD-dependent oxidoreductase [Pirellulaceae bacterium]
MKQILAFVLLPLVWSGSLSAAEPVYDVVIYGGTSGGVAAAVQTSRMGKTAILIEPGQHLGGLTSGGLGATDIGNKAAIGGIAREFYRRIKKHYDDRANWRQEKREAYRSGRATEAAAEDAMWTFEPHVAEQLMNELVREAKVSLVLGERLDLKRGVEKQGGEILSIRMESGKVYRGRRFIDATYEGDLLALAGVSFHVGREADSVYDETLNGVQVAHAVKHQLMAGIDPYVKRGDKSSGLLPGVLAGPPGTDGSGDKRVQAYNFRLCLTDVKENQIPYTKPAGYDPLRYELLLRNFEAGETRTPWNPIFMPNRKTDVNNNYGFSTDNIGMNYDWAEADYSTRDRIFEEHLRYTQGLLWTLATNDRVPTKVREEVNRFGLCKDEFQKTGGWNHQLYIREARRMIGAYVMTQSDCQRKRTADDPVGLGAYNMDSHNVQRYVDEHGHARNEGDVQVGVSPYPISYRAIIPKESECTNLFAPVCLSASHIAYGSIRMEPVFMVLGQSAATAAVQSIDRGVNVQKVDFARLRERLLADGQVLEWKGPIAKSTLGIDPKKLPGIVLDDTAGEKSGDWQTSSSIGGFVGSSYLHDGNANKGKLAINFGLKVAQPGEYEVRLWYTANPNRATNVPVFVQHAGGETKLTINQKQQPKLDGQSITLGRFKFDKVAGVVISNAGTDGYVIADAVQFISVKPK